MQDVEQRAEKQAEELAGRTESKKAVTRSGVEKRIDAVADYIVGRIVNG